MASDSFTSILGFLLQGTGNNNNTWGALLNTGDFDQIELAIAGINSQTVTGGTLDLSGSPPPAGPSGAIHAVLNLSGTLGSNQIVKVPNLAKIWLVNNGCSLAGFTLTFKTPSGSASAAIPVGWCFVWCDGNNNILVGISTSNRDVQMLAPDGTLAAPGIAFTSEAGTGVRRKGTQDVCITINGIDIIEITGAGAGSPNIVNVLVGALQQAGANVLTAGTPGIITASLLATGAAPLPYMGAQTNDNLHILNDGTNPTRDINVTAGRVRDDSDATNLQLAATMFKRLDTAWAAGGPSGSPAGACDTGVKGNSQTWHAYHIGKLALTPTTYARSGTTVTINFGSAHGLGAGGTLRVIGIGSGFDGLYAINSVTTNALTYTSANSGTVNTTNVPSGATCDGFDVLASQNYNSPTMPSGWTVKQCLGSVLTDGSANILAFLQLGDEFLLKAAGTLDRNNDTISTTPTNFALTHVPNGVRVQAIMNVVIDASSTAIVCHIYPTDFTDPSAPTTTTAPLGSLANFVTFSGGSQTNDFIGGQCRVWTDTSRNIRTIASAAGGLYIVALGWRDPRRRMF